MYRDDKCAVCGESLPPDHFYCREHAAEVDRRLHEIGLLLARVTTDLGQLATLLDGVAEPTWDYVAEQVPGDPHWPVVPQVRLRADADEVEVSVDPEPGYIRSVIAVGLPQLLAALHEGLDTVDMHRFAETCARVEGAGATH